jgi:hypothetical protein
MNSWHSLWSHGKRQLPVVIAVGTLIIVCGFPSLGRAYDLKTHRRIVTDAVDFIIASREKTSTYVDGSTGQSDDKLLSSVYANADDGKLRQIAAEMAEASADTDLRTDIWLQVPGLFGSTPQPGEGNVSFTSFSHFINVRNPGYAWQFSGYYANQKCSDAGFEDKIANFFVGNSKARVDIKKSEAFTIYKNPLLDGISDAQYQDHIKQQIRHVHFWPITNIASYWFQRFRTEPAAANGGPYNLSWIGPVLHAGGDSTVPYHAAGLSGCGHGVYESEVEKAYDSESLYDRNAVQTLLESERHLDRRLSVVEIVSGNARKAADSPFCRCALNACDCPIAYDSSARRKLVNLAIASTVVLIRKAFFEWQANGGSLPTLNTVRPEIPIGREPRTFSSTADVPSDQIFVVQLKSGDVRPFQDSLKARLTKLREIISFFEIRGVATDVFPVVFHSVIDDISRVVSEYPTLEWNPLFQPPRKQEYSSSYIVGSESVRFRLPTEQELDGIGRIRYIEQRRRFFAARGLYITALTRAAITGRLSRISDSEQKEAEQYINDLRKAEEYYMTLLPSTQGSFKVER